MREVIEAYFDGINEERYEDVGRLFADDGVLIAPGIAPLTGPQEIGGYFARALAPYPVHHDGPTRMVFADRTVTVEIDFTGELASGVPMAFSAIDIFDLDEDGKIVKLTTWYDSHLVRGKLADALVGEGAQAQALRALRTPRKGAPVALGGTWRTAPAAPLATRAVLVDANALDGVTVEPGDVLLVRAGGEPVPAGTLPQGVTIATDGTVDGDPGGPVAEGLDLDAAQDALGGRRQATALFVSVPSPDGAANAALIV